jgi:fatty-acyl-CoA synthase
VILNGFPLFHVAGAFVFGLATLLTGGEVVLPTLLGMRHKAFVDRYWTFVERHGVSLLAAVPTVMATLLDVPPGNAQLGGVRALLTGGSPLPQELAAGFERRFHIKVRNILGMTECAGVIAIEPWLASRVPGSCGLRLPFTQIHAAGENGQALAAGETGVLCVKGPNVGPGYTESERNAGTFTDDGWLITGDVGYVDDKGLVFITGRAKDLIIRSSHNIDPRVIEDALLRHPDVIMAAAVGEPDEYAGEIPVAFVVLRPGSMAQPQELADFAQPLIPERPAFPKRVEVLPALPLTAIGKIYKPALKAMAIRHAIAQRLAQAGLAARVSVDVVDEGVRQTVVFNVNDAAPRDALVGELGQLMSRFAIHYRVVG